MNMELDADVANVHSKFLYRPHRVRIVFMFLFCTLPMILFIALTKFQRLMISSMLKPVRLGGCAGGGILCCAC